MTTEEREDDVISQNGLGRFENNVFNVIPRTLRQASILASTMRNDERATKEAPPSPPTHASACE
jgi:hypothetical protein